MSAPKIKSKDINGKTVVITLLGAKDGIKMSKLLMTRILPSVTTLANGAATQNLAAAMKDLVMTLEDVDLYEMTEKLFANATVNDFPINPNDYFSGNYGEYLDFMEFALEANFGSFFEASRLSSLNFLGLKA
ncbi:hypothetical protein K6R49_003729 [Escherichia coli]|nr:hypothetical protein [Escherichia coli]